VRGGFAHPSSGLRSIAKPPPPTAPTGQVRTLGQSGVAGAVGFGGPCGGRAAALGGHACKQLT